MAIATIRRYTEDDQSRVRAAAERFCARHGIKFDSAFADDAEASIDHWIHESYPEDKAYRRKLWMGCYCRALQVPCDVRTTTGYGYIGVTVN